MIRLMKTWYSHSILFLLLLSVFMNACATTPAEQTGVVIEYQRSGGYAGVDERYSIDANGLISSNKNRQGQTDRKDLDYLMLQVRTQGFYELASKYIPKNACCDGFSYQLKITDGTHTHTVSAVGGDPRAPEQLWDILKLVQQFIEDETVASTK